MKDEDILIKLKRKFGKDELVSFLNKKIKELEIEKGELLSEIDFLNYIIEQDRYQYSKSINQSNKKRIVYQQKKKKMTKENFLKESDINITNVDFSDSKDENGKTDVVAILELQEDSNQIMLTKENLQFLLSEIVKEENYIQKNGFPSYIDNE